jgi:hypothetical protein
MEMDNWLTWRMDASPRKKQILAREEEERRMAETVATVLLCTIGSAKKFGDRLAVGSLVTCSRAGEEFWIWGADRPMSLPEIETCLRQQIEAKIVAEC